MGESLKNHRVVIAAVFATVLVAGVLAAYALQDRAVAPQNNTSSTGNATSGAASNTAQANAVVIVFNNDGFAQRSYTVKKGQTVTVKNDSTMSLQFSSDDHPAHRDNTELNMTTLAAGQSGVFTPNKIGTWGFHDHINSQFTGTLVVEE